MAWPSRSIDTGIPLAYVNRVGGQDEVVFDGASFVVGGRRCGRNCRNGRGRGRHGVDQGAFGQRPPALRGGRRGRAGRTPRDIYCAMVVALRDYVNKNRFPGVILGLSGGIDSALCAAIAVDALGADRVWCVMLPSRYQPGKPRRCRRLRADAGRAARYRADRPGSRLYRHAGAAVCRARADLTEENLQSRIRGTTLMALSNKFGRCW
jgi:NAD+ synthase